MFSMQYLDIVLITLVACFNSYSESDTDVDTYSYNDDLYDQLEYEYIQELVKVTTVRQESYNAVTLPPAKKNSMMTTVLVVTEMDDDEIKLKFLARAKEIQCENPWFWYTFECVILDIRNRYYTKRLKRNASVAGPIISVFFLTILGCFLYAYCRLKFQFRRIFPKLHQAYKFSYKLKAGVIELPDGEIRLYEPSVEEIEALNHLVEVIS